MAAHAFQAAFEAVIWKVFLFLAMIASTVYSLVRIFQLATHDWKGFSWQEMGIKLLISLFVIVLVTGINAIQSAFQARQAWRGDWPRRGTKWTGIKAMPKS